MSDIGKPRKPRAAKPKSQPDDAGRAVLERIAQTGKGTTQTESAQTGTPPKARTGDGKATHKPASTKAAASVKGKSGGTPKAAPSSRPPQSKRRSASGPSHGDRLGLIVLVLVILAAAGARFLLPGPRAALPSAGQLQLRFLDTQPGTVLLTSPEGQTLLYGLSRSGPDLLAKYGVKRPDLLLAGSAAIPASWKGTASVPAGQSRLGSVQLRVLDGPVLNGRQGTPGLLLSYGEFRALLTGEAGAGAAQSWLVAGGESTYGPVQIYQGLRRGETAAWISAVRPEAVVLSLGKAPTLGAGPDAKTLDLYRQSGARIWRSDVSGTISFTATVDGRFVAQAER